MGEGSGLPKSKDSISAEGGWLGLRKGAGLGVGCKEQTGGQRGGGSGEGSMGPYCYLGQGLMINGF